LDLFYREPLFLALTVQLGRGRRSFDQVAVCGLNRAATLLIASFSKMAELVDGDPSAELTNNVEACLVAFDGIDVAGSI
jgi:hypothetical protein